jgi:nucleoside-diphosphate-sugar epimerase
MKNILILGGAGYLGTASTAYFLSKRYNVTCIDNVCYQQQNAILPFLSYQNYTFINGDFADTRLLDQHSKNVDVVIVLAGLVGDDVTKKYPTQAHEVNNRSTLAVIDYFKDKRLKFIFVSSCSNYGLIEHGKIADETFELTPLSLYAEDKVAVEEYLLDVQSSANKFSPAILRFATAFGVAGRMRLDLTINEFVYKLLMGQSLDVFGLEAWRPYCHVSDFAKAFDILIHAPDNAIAGEVFNVGHETNNFTKRSLISLILETLPQINPAQIVVKDQVNDPRDYRVSFNKFNDKFKYYSYKPVLHGIKEIADAVKQGVFVYNMSTLPGRGGNFEL